MHVITEAIEHPLDRGMDQAPWPTAYLSPLVQVVNSRIVLAADLTCMSRKWSKSVPVRGSWTKIGRNYRFKWIAYHSSTNDLITVSHQMPVHVLYWLGWQERTCIVDTGGSIVFKILTERFMSEKNTWAVTTCSSPALLFSAALTE